MLSNAIIRQVEDELTNHPGALISVIDPDGVFWYLSPSLKTLLGFDPQEAFGRNLADYFTPAEASHFMLTIQDALLRGKSVSTTRTAPHKNGGTRRMRGRMICVVDDNSGQEYVISIALPVE